MVQQTFESSIKNQSVCINQTFVALTAIPFSIIGTAYLSNLFVGLLEWITSFQKCLCTTLIEGRASILPNFDFFVFQIFVVKLEC